MDWPTQLNEHLYYANLQSFIFLILDMMQYYAEENPNLFTEECLCFLKSS